MPFELANLRTVMTAARLGSFSRAAEHLHLTQSALSRRIAEAEAALGITLFKRKPRGVQATEACLEFLRHAEIALNSIENGREAAREVESRRLGTIAFGFLENLCDDRLLSACRRTLDEIDGASIDFRPRTLSSELTDDLLAGSTKLGMRYRRASDPQLESLWVADDPIVVACAASHSLARTGRATMDDLEQAQWIGSSADFGAAATGQADEKLYAGWTAMTMVPIFARLKLVEAGFGLAMVRRAALRETRERGTVVELETPLELSLPIYLTWRRGTRLGRACEHFRETICRLYGADTSAEDGTSANAGTQI